MRARGHKGGGYKEDLDGDFFDDFLDDFNLDRLFDLHLDDVFGGTGLGHLGGGIFVVIPEDGVLASTLFRNRFCILCSVAGILYGIGGRCVRRTLFGLEFLLLLLRLGRLHLMN